MSDFILYHIVCLGKYAFFFFTIKVGDYFAEANKSERNIFTHRPIGFCWYSKYQLLWRKNGGGVGKEGCGCISQNVLLTLGRRTMQTSEILHNCYSKNYEV